MCFVHRRQWIWVKNWKIVKKAVKEGVIDEVGGIKDALNKLHKLIEKKTK